MYPDRIVCLTEEPTEVLYALGEQARIVGISGFTVRPARARKEKPPVSAFTSAKVDEITRLSPDLAIGFSDIQADIAQALVKRGVEVWIANHRTVDGIISYVRRLGAMVGAGEKAEEYADLLEARVAAVPALGKSLQRRPKVYLDADLDGILEPNGAALVMPPVENATAATSVTVTTDNSGSAAFWVVYPPAYAAWTKIELKVTAAVAGQNNTASRSY